MEVHSTLPLKGVQVRSLALVGELKSCLPHGVGKNPKSKKERKKKKNTAREERRRRAERK